MVLEYQPPEELGLLREDLPRPGWPRPAPHLPPFHDAFTDYVRAVAPGVYVGCACASSLGVAEGEWSAGRLGGWARRGAAAPSVALPPARQPSRPRPLLRVPQAGLPHRRHRPRRQGGPPLLPHGGRPQGPAKAAAVALALVRRCAAAAESCSAAAAVPPAAGTHPAMRSSLLPPRHRSPRLLCCACTLTAPLSRARSPVPAHSSPLTPM